MTPLRFLFIFVFLCTRCFLRNRLREYVPAIIASITAKFEQFLWERFWNIWKRSFKNHKNIETSWRKQPQLPPFPIFPFSHFHRSFIYRKAFLYMAVNCGKFENILVPGVIKSGLGKHFVISRNFNCLFLFILWLGICVDVPPSPTSPPPPSPHHSVVFVCLFCFFFILPTVLSSTQVSVIWNQCAPKAGFGAV